MKIVFLDIDGVLVNRNSLVQQSGMRARGDRDCVAALNRIIESTNASIVVSSTWRFGGLQNIREILYSWGVKARIIDITPDLTRKQEGLYHAVTRGFEIYRWLCDHSLEVEQWVILDDEQDDDMAPWVHVRTVFETGLTQADADRAIGILQAQPQAAGASL